MGDEGGAERGRGGGGSSVNLLIARRLSPRFSDTAPSRSTQSFFSNSPCQRHAAIFPAGVRRALVLVGSQKTLPIAVTVLSQLGPLVKGPLGLAVIPCVAAHLSQILIDSVLVSHWLRKDAANLDGSARA